jgi:hypothetical protein
MKLLKIMPASNYAFLIQVVSIYVRDKDILAFDG